VTQEIGQPAKDISASRTLIKPVIGPGDKVYLQQGNVIIGYPVDDEPGRLGAQGPRCDVACPCD
jgi:hypothetical protein